MTSDFHYFGHECTCVVRQRKTGKHPELRPEGREYYEELRQRQRVAPSNTPFRMQDHGDVCCLSNLNKMYAVFQMLT